MEQTNAEVGFVMALTHATPFEWIVAIKEDAFLQMGDLVETITKIPGATAGARPRQVRLSGLVVDVGSVHEGVKLETDVFLTRRGVLPCSISRTARVRTTRVQEVGSGFEGGPGAEVWVPPLPGDAVVRVVGDSREAALYMDQMREDERVPIGLTRDQMPYVLDFAFFAGEKGGHVNISGISGVATKTSMASMLLYSLFHNATLPQRIQNNAKAVIFNVKGEDLLFLDKKNTMYENPTTPAEMAKARAVVEGYAAMQLPMNAFKSVSFRVPPQKVDDVSLAVVPHVSSRPLTDAAIVPYWWTVRDVVTQRLLRYLFSEGQDHGSQVTDLAMLLEDRLAKDFQVVPSSPWAVSLPKPGAKSSQGARVIVATLKELVDYIEAQFEQEDSEWTGKSAGQTLMAFNRRLNSAERHLKHLIRPQVNTRAGGPLEDLQAQVTVIDIHQLAERAQRFVVGVVLSRIFEARETQPQNNHVFVVLDELNKYAPREGDSPLKEVLLDIAERGRSMNVLLIGAQQTASEVERRIVSNAAVRILGRLDLAEAQRPEYAFLDTNERARVGLLKPGSMLVLQPHVPMAIEISFPFPCWATRSREANMTPPAATSGFQAIVPTVSFGDL